MRKDGTGAVRADVALLSITAIWGFTFPAVQNALADVDAVTFVAVRFALAALALYAASRGRALRVSRSEMGYGIALGVCLASGSLLQTVGLAYTTAPRSAFITALYVVITPVIALIMARRWPHPATFGAIALAVIGLYLITDPHISGVNLGDWLTVACSFAFGIHILVAERAAARRDAMALTFWQVLTTGFIASLLLGIQGHARFELTFWSLLALGVTAFLATAVAFGVQMWAQRHTTATHAALIFAAEPVFAAIFSFLIKGNVMGPEALLGGGLILGSILLVQVGAGKRAAERVPTTAAE